MRIVTRPRVYWWQGDPLGAEMVPTDDFPETMIPYWTLPSTISVVRELALVVE
jgi:hypothetical protein